jgi:hypothetical protein
MLSIDSFYIYLDPLLIFAFRLPWNAYVGYALGLIWLAFLVTLLGELTMAGVYLLNRSHFLAQKREMVSHLNLSIKALAAKDKDSYKACNSIANEAFGRNFFSGIALFASSLWPVPFALGWLEFRFATVEFTLPLVGAVGSAFLFIPTYIVVRILFSKAKPYLPFFSYMTQLLRQQEANEERMLTYMDMVKREEEK